MTLSIEFETKYEAPSGDLSTSRPTIPSDFGGRIVRAGEEGPAGFLHLHI